MVGDMVLLTKLVMLWQLLEREGPEINPGTGRAGRNSLLTPQCSSSWRRQLEAAQQGLPWPHFRLCPFSSLSGNFHRTASTDRNCRVNQLHTTAYISTEFFCIIKCPKVLFKGFNYILVWHDCVQANVSTIRISGSHQAAREDSAPRPINLWAGGTAKTRNVLAPTLASGQPPGSPEALAPIRQEELTCSSCRVGQLKCGCRALFCLLIYVPMFERFIGMDWYFQPKGPQVSYSQHKMRTSID